MRRSTTPRSEQGHTLVELLVAAMVLVVGVLGALTLIDGANNSTAITSARIGATNLARELTEHARTTDYEELTPAGLAGKLQARMGSSGAANPFTVTRRATTYTVSVSTCVYDDPHDGLGTPTPGDGLSYCPTTAALPGATQEVNPDDFRRVTVTVAWTHRNRERRMTQSELIANPSGGLGPRITKFVTEPTAQITNDDALTFAVTTTPARSVRWTVDSASSSGGDAVAAGSLPATSWSIPWTLGSYGVNPFVVDGIYRMSAQAFDGRGIPGDQRVITIPLNRHAPLAVPSRGGRNARWGGANGIVDLQWQASAERDVLGYRVVRASDGATVCPGSGEYTTALSCVDTDPPSGSIEYRVYAVDRTDILDAASATRSGAPSTVPVDAAGTEPPAPTGLAVTINAEGRPVLTWTDPTGGTALEFRIYRDGALLADRYDVVPGTVTEYTDPQPGTEPHTYRVSAVSSSFGESALSAPAAP